MRKANGECAARVPVIDVHLYILYKVKVLMRVTNSAHTYGEGR